MMTRMTALFHHLAQPLVHQYALLVTAVLLLGKLVIRAILFIPFDGLPQEGFLTNVGNVFLWSYVIVLMVYWSKSRIVKCCAYGLLFILFFIGEFLKNVFLKNISPDVLMLLGETNGREIFEFLREYAPSRGALIAAGVTLLFVLLAVLMERYTTQVVSYVHRQLHRKTVIGIVTFVFLIHGVVSSFSYLRMAQCKTLDDLALWELDNALYADPITHTASACYGITLMSKEMERFISVTEQACRQETPSSDNDSLNIIVVIGESFIKWHSNLYGYSLNTCPYQQAEADSGRLFVFDRVYTTSNFTSLALKDLFSCNSTDDGESWEQYPFFPALMKQAGYDVFMWDNQRDTYSSMTLAFSLNSCIYNDRLQALSYSQTNTQNFQYDAELLRDYAQHVKRENKRNLVFFHLMGQHFDASKRYPQDKRHQHFKWQDIKRKDAYLTQEKRQEIADYDNATRYHDEVLKQVFDMYKDEQTVVIAFSDHGEEIYDFRDSKGRAEAGDYPAEMRRYQYQVPFVVWCSDQYKEHHPEDVQRICQAVDKPYNIDDLCQMVFRLAGVRTPFYRERHDPLSEKYAIRTTSMLSDSQYFIAHGCGEIDGYTYTNSLEALQKSIASGYRYIEIDLAMTSDSVLVCSHGFEDFPDGYIPTAQEFKEHKIQGRYTTLTLDDVIQIWRQSSFVLVTDKISDTQLLNSHFNKQERQRVLVETPYKDHYRALQSAGYVPMFCLHHFNVKAFLYLLKLRLIDGLDIKRLVVSTESNSRLLHFVRRHLDAKVAMYTSNSPDFFLRHLDYDADLIYTDNWNVSKEQHYNNKNTNTY